MNVASQLEAASGQLGLWILLSNYMVKLCALGHFFVGKIYFLLVGEISVVCCSKQNFVIILYVFNSSKNEM